MKTGILLGLGALAVAGVALAATPIQDAKAKTHDDAMAAHGGEQMAAMMEAMIKAATPGVPHKAMAQDVGTWQTHTKSWNPVDPDLPPETSEGTSELSLALGGRYLVEHHSSTMPGMGPFEGMGILAYNNVTGEYEHVWMDTFSTGIMLSKGTESADGTLTMKGSFDDCMTGEKVACRMVSRKVSDDERVFEMYCNKDGKESQMMEITYTRGAE